MANYGAWGPDGSLYVTDFLQGVVWRVPPGGGEAQVWLSDRRLDGGEFGTTGIALAADQRTLLIAQGSSAGLGALNPTTGKIYAVEIGPNGSPGDLRQLWESGPADLPDGFTIARSGKLYVPLAGVANQLAVLAPDGTELERFPSSSGDGGNGSAVPFDTPSSARFLGTRLMVANQSFTGDRENQAVLDVETQEPGLPELIPGRDTGPPALSRVAVSRKRVRAGSRRRMRVRFNVSERSRVSVRIERRVPPALARRRQRHAAARAGPGGDDLQQPQVEARRPPRGGPRRGRRAQPVTPGDAPLPRDALTRFAPTLPRSSFAPPSAGNGRRDERSTTRNRRDAGPRASRPPALVEVALARRHRPRHRLDPRRPRGHDRRLDRRPADRPGERPRAERRAGAQRRRDLRPRRLPRRARVRAADRPLRPQEAVHGDAGALPGGHRRDRVLLERRASSSSAASSPAPASAASTPRSTPRSTS